MFETKFVNKISVIIPVYNVEQYLDRCIQSVLNQTYTNLEILLINDGSTDSSGSICDEYAKKDSRIRVFHQNYSGVAESRNVGLDNCSGKYILFVDSDDWIIDNAVEVLYKNLTEKDLDISCASATEVMINGTSRRYNPMGDQVFSSQESLMDLILDKKLRTVVWNKLYKAELFEGIRYPKGLIHEDEFVTYKLFLGCNRIGFIDKETYYYCRRKNSIMGKGRTKETLVYLQAWYDRMIACQNAGYCKCASIAKYLLISRCFDFRFKFNVTKEVHEVLGPMWKSFGLKMSAADMKCVQFIDQIKVTIKWILLNLVY